MIPKVIHYCWFGGNPKPEIIQKCIASWKRVCPEWEIVEWNESNYDISKSQFMQEAYASKKWGFVPDYARFDIVYQMGGVYLDTDVELFKSLDDWLKYDAFFAFESGRNIGCGLGFGAEKGHQSVKECLKYYEERHFLIDGKMDQTPSPRINTKSLCAVYPQLRRNGQNQVLENTLFVSPATFNQYAKHWGTATWVDGYKAQPHVYKDNALKRCLRREQNFNFIERVFGERAVNLYTVLAYDVLEYGIVYYIKRKMK